MSLMAERFITDRPVVTHVPTVCAFQSSRPAQPWLIRETHEHRRTLVSRGMASALCGALRAAP